MTALATSALDVPLAARLAPDTLGPGPLVVHLDVDVLDS